MGSRSRFFWKAATHKNRATIPVVTTYLPIAISIVSLALSCYATWRTTQAEKPIWWIDVARTEKPDFYLATVSIRNQSRYDLRLESVMVPIQAVPVTRKQDFVLVEYANALEGRADGTMGLVSNFDKAEKSLKFSLTTPKTIHSGGAETQKFWLLRSPISTAEAVEITFGVRTMKQNPKYELIVLEAKIPSGGIVLGI
jgi:hypothetical protein